MKTEISDQPTPPKLDYDRLIAAIRQMPNLVAAWYEFKTGRQAGMNREVISPKPTAAVGPSQPAS